MEPAELAPSTPPPTRRRRRWPIVALMLVLAGGVASWFWPRGDARFVGKWECLRDGEPEARFGYDFSSDGRGSCFDTRSTHRSDFFWHVADGKLVTRSRHILLNQGVDGFIAGICEKLTGMNFGVHVMCYDIQSVSADEITMKSTETFVFGGGRQVLRRIPE